MTKHIFWWSQDSCQSTIVCCVPSRREQVTIVFIRLDCLAARDFSSRTCSRIEFPTCIHRCIHFSWSKFPCFLVIPWIVNVFVWARKSVSLISQLPFVCAETLQAFSFVDGIRTGFFGFKTKREFFYTHLLIARAIFIVRSLWWIICDEQTKGVATGDAWKWLCLLTTRDLSFTVRLLFFITISNSHTAYLISSSSRTVVDSFGY
jgi:hypothetical protein